MRKVIPSLLLVFVFIPLLGLQTSKWVIPYKTPNGKYNVGDTASDFTLPDVYGNEYSLYDYKGKIILLHVGPTWCGGCQEQAASYEKIWNLYKDKDVVVIGINIGESASGLLDFIKHYNIQHPMLMDYQYQVHHEYQTYMYSHTIIIDRNMEITLRGHYPEKEIMEELDRLLKIQPSATETTSNLNKCSSDKSAAGALVCDDELVICYYRPAGKNRAAKQSQPPQTAKGWAKAQALTKDAGNNFDPRMTRDSNGNIWVTWYSDQAGDNNIFALYYDGKEWSDQFRITKDKGDDYNPVMVADKKGGVWLAWVSNRNGNYDIFVKHFDGEKWSDARPITTYFEDDMRPALTVDSTGKLWAVWYTWEKMNSAFFPGSKISRDRNLYISYYNGKEWSERQLISPPAEVDMSDDHVDPALAIDGKVKIWFTWSCDYHPQRRKNPIKGAEGPSIFSRYFDGQSWSDITAASAMEDEKEQSSANYYPSMAVDKSGIIWLSYEGVRVRDTESDRGASNHRFGFRSIFVNHVENNAWQQPNALTNYEATNEEPCLIIDNRGNPHVFWYTDKGSWNLYESNYTGDSWTSPSPVTIGENNDVRPSACVDSEGTIWLTWYSKTGKNFNIYYTYKKADSEDPKEALKSMGITPYPELKQLEDLKFKEPWMQVETISPEDVNESFSNLDDLIWLKPIALNNKVVLLGEHHYYQYIEHLRNRILFALNTFDRYHLLVFELPYSATGYMEHYVSIKNDAEANDFYKTVMYEMLPTKEIYNIVEYIRTWNKTHPEKFIHIGCHDIEHLFKTTIKKIIIPYFKKLDAGFNIDMEMINWRDLDAILIDIEQRLQNAKKENIIGEYPFITPQYIECVLENLTSLFNSKRYEFNYYREKAMVRNLTDPRFLGKFFTGGKVMMHCGGYHASKYLNYPEGGNFFREGSYITHEFELTKGKTFSLLASGFAYQLGPMADIDLDSYVRYGSGYTNTIKTYQKAKEKGLVTPERYYLFNGELDEFSKLVFKISYENNHLPMIIKRIDWKNIIEKAKSDSEEVYEVALTTKDTFDQFDVIILVPRSPITRLKEEINQ